MASGRFGVTSEYLVNADEFQIKMAQGAKPGEGGQLPGHKVWPWIAKVRFSTPGVGLISPPPHHDIYSIEDLAQLIYDLKNSNPRGADQRQAGGRGGRGHGRGGRGQAHSDVVLISGPRRRDRRQPADLDQARGDPLGAGPGRDAADPRPQQASAIGSSSRPTASSRPGATSSIAALLGAEEYGFATAPLVVMGCIMMRVCHLDTCPVGIATQNPKLREKFRGQAEHVVNFFRFIAQEVRELMAQLGFRTIDEMIGRSDLLDMRKAIDHYKAKGLDFSKIFYRPEVGPEVAVRKVRDAGPRHRERRSTVTTLFPRCAPALERGEPVVARACRSATSTGRWARSWGAS